MNSGLWPFQKSHKLNIGR